MLVINPLIAKDFYKAGHKFQYPEGTEEIYSNFTPRSAHLFKGSDREKVLNFGIQGFIQYFLMETFTEGFFTQPKEKVVGEYKQLVDTALGCDMDVSHIAALHDLGYLPIEIKALPEGRLVPIKVPVLTIRNTIPEFYWLPNYLETAISADLWKSITNATIAFEYRVLIEYWARITGSPIDFVQWQGHDFSYRGLSTSYDAMITQASHLTCFLGTDTIPAIDFINKYYDGKNTFVGGSVPASEHSTMCAGGMEDELKTFQRMLDLYPTGVVSIVSDTWNFWNVVGDETSIAAKLKDKILARQPNAVGLAKTVFRPDSGNPADILCGVEVITVDSLEEAEEFLHYNTEWEEGESYGPDEASGYFEFEGQTYEVTVYPEWSRHDKRFYFIDGWCETKFKKVTLTPEQKGAVQCLWDIFGGTVTENGFKLLDSHVGLIYGDSITLDRADEIFQRLAAKGFASANVVFGIGSFTYQYNTRDTFGFAMKATHAIVNGQGRELFKDPVTDSGVKKSAKGYLRVEEEDGTYVLYDQQTPAQERLGALQTVFRDGGLFGYSSIADIRCKVATEVAKALDEIGQK